MLNDIFLHKVDIVMTHTPLYRKAPKNIFPSLTQIFSFIFIASDTVGNKGYQGVRNIRFLEDLTRFIFLKQPFWDSRFCVITNDIFFFFMTVIYAFLDMKIIIHSISYLKGWKTVTKTKVVIRKQLNGTWKSSCRDRVVKVVIIYTENDIQF